MSNNDSVNCYYGILNYPTRSPSKLGHVVHVAKFYSPCIEDAKNYLTQDPRLHILKPTIRSNDIISSANLLPQDWYTSFIYDEQSKTLHSLFMRRSFYIDKVNVTKNKDRTYINFWYFDELKIQKRFSFILGNDLVENCRDFLLKDVVSCYAMKQEKGGVLSYTIPIVRTKQSL